MNNLLKLILIFLLFNTATGYSQNVIEVPKPQNTEFIDSLFNELTQKKDSFYTAINILEQGLKNANTNYEIYKITFNLGFLYTKTNQLDKCVDMWLAANKKGLCYNYQFDDNPRPEYLSAYKGDERFKKFMYKNDSIKKKISEETISSYFVTLPADYKKSNNYPLIIIMHGRIGNFQRSYKIWQSKEIQDNFIAVYTQGREIQDSFFRTYGETGIEDIKEIYSRVIQKYSVDKSSVILAGQSAGGALSLDLANGHIKAKGLFLAFPVKPNNFDFNRAQNLKNSSTKIYMVCGEQDEKFFSGQVELSALLDKAKVENQFISYPDLGHEFPYDFNDQLDNGLDFILYNK